MRSEESILDNSTLVILLLLLPACMSVSTICHHHRDQPCSIQALEAHWNSSQVTLSTSSGTQGNLKGLDKPLLAITFAHQYIAKPHNDLCLGLFKRRCCRQSPTHLCVDREDNRWRWSGGLVGWVGSHTIAAHVRRADGPEVFRRTRVGRVKQAAPGAGMARGAGTRDEAAPPG
jgi:hypothetical protein